jgi:hypothetical protein
MTVSLVHKRKKIPAESHIGLPVFMDLELFSHKPRAIDKRDLAFFETLQDADAILADKRHATQV